MKKILSLSLPSQEMDVRWRMPLLILRLKRVLNPLQSCQEMNSALTLPLLFAAAIVNHFENKSQERQTMDFNESVNRYRYKKLF